MHTFFKEENERKAREHQERRDENAKFCAANGSDIIDSATSVGVGINLTLRCQAPKEEVRKKLSQQRSGGLPAPNLKAETLTPLVRTAKLYLVDGELESTNPPAESDEEEKILFELLDAQAAPIEDKISKFKLATDLSRPGFSRAIVRNAPKAAGKDTPSAVDAPDPTISVTTGNEFPVKDVSGASACGDPAQALIALCRRLHGHGDYARERDEYCRLSIRLNLDGKQAPAFRQELSFKANAPSPVRLDIHRDQIVIDLHWCHAKRLPVTPLKTMYELMFDADAPFPFLTAWDFANQKWKKTYRADEVLTLTTMQQCQLAAIRNEGIAARFVSIYKGVRSGDTRTVSTASVATRNINRWAERDGRIRPLEYIKLWCARELLDQDATSKEIANLSALMTGHDALDRSTVQQKLKRLDMQLKKSLF